MIAVNIHWRAYRLQLIEHLETEALYIEVLGKQAPKGARGAAADLTVYNQGAKGGGANSDKADQLEKKLVRTGHTTTNN